jgi:hypothetical protein
VKQELKQLVERPDGFEFLTIKTDEPQIVGDSLVKAGAVMLGINAVSGKSTFFIVQGQLVLVEYAK